MNPVVYRDGLVASAKRIIVRAPVALGIRVIAALIDAMVAA